MTSLDGFANKLHLSNSSGREKQIFAADSTSTVGAPGDDDSRWSLQTELAKPFNNSLKRTFGASTRATSIIGTCTKDDGDYECKTLIHVWPEVKKNRRFKGLKQAQLAFMKNLSASRSASEIMERSVLCLQGYVRFTISRRWIAKNIRKMLIDGIDTWAPKLPMKKAIIEFSSRDVPEDMDFGHIRSAIIADTLARIIEFSRVEVIRRSNLGDDQERSRKRYEQVFRLLDVQVEEKSKSLNSLNISRTLDLLRNKDKLVEVSEGQEVIFVGERMLPLVKKDGSFYSASTHLAALWHGLNEENAKWIIYVTDIGQHDYFKMCIIVARYAEWISADNCKHPINQVGVGRVEGDDLRRFQNSSKQVVDLLYEAKNRCEAALVEQGEADKWTSEELERAAQALGYGAVRYENLKNHRWTNYTFNFDQMLNDKGNTAPYLQYTHARICSIIRKFGKEIEGLKKTGELILKNDEERELGLHLLRFNEVVAKVCILLTPHILCEYLYDLAEKFNGLYSSFVCEQKSVVGIVGSAKETGNLLLCEAIAVVMTKCFDLLGITPITNRDNDFTVTKQSQATSAERGSFSKVTDEPVINLTSRPNITNRDNDSTVPEQNQATSAKRVYFSDLTDEQLIDMFHKCLLLRFELYSVIVYSENFCKNPKMFGFIKANAKPGSLSCGLGADPASNAFFPVIFNREYEESVGLLKAESVGFPEAGFLSLNHDICFCSISTSMSLQIVAQLYVIVDEDDLDYHDDDANNDDDDEVEKEEDVKKDYVFNRDKHEETFKYDYENDLNRHGDWVRFDIEKDDDDYHNEVDEDKITVEAEDVINNQVFEVCNVICALNLDYFAKSLYGGCGYTYLNGPGGSIQLHYVALKYAVDASLDVEFVVATGKETQVVGSVIAYYGKDFEYICRPDTEHLYKATLYETKPGIFVKPGKINLLRSVLAVPAKFSLRIEANFRDLTLGVEIMNGSCEFPVPCDGSSSEDCIKGSDCSLNLKVDWKLPRDMLPL